MFTKNDMIEAINKLNNRHPDNYKAICKCNHADLMEDYRDNFDRYLVEFKVIGEWLADRVLPSGFTDKFNLTTSSGSYNHIINDWDRWKHLSKSINYIRSSTVIIFFASSDLEYKFRRKSDPVAYFKIGKHVAKERFLKID